MPTSLRKEGRCRPVLRRVARGVRIWVAICEATAERTPLSPASMAMKNVVEPQQCTTICTLFAPVSSRTLADRGGIILGGHVVAARLKRGGRQLDAGAVIEQPHVVAVSEKVFEQIGFDGVDGEDQARDAQPMREDDRTLGASLIASQAKPHAIRSLEERDLRRAHAQRALLAGRSIRIEHAGPGEHVGISVEQRTEKEPRKPRSGFNALGRGCRH